MVKNFLAYLFLSALLVVIFVIGYEPIMGYYKANPYIFTQADDFRSQNLTAEVVFCVESGVEVQHTKTLQLNQNK